MTSSAGRVVCPRCGANNFDTVATCWKCQAPITAAAGSRLRSMVEVPNAPIARMPAVVTPVGGSGDPALSKRAALWLALSMPYIGLPVGWAFMMMNDQERQAIGKFCVNWSMIAMVFHLLLMWVSFEAFVPTLQAMVGMAAKLAPHGAAGNGLGSY